MELSIEKLRSPRRRSSSSSSFSPEDQASSACSTPFVSAPSSPRYYYYSAPPSPPLRNDLDNPGGAEAAVPFSWEERPGTPKSSSPTSSSSSRTTMKSSVDHLAAMGMGFHFSAPVSPQRGEFDHQVNGGLIDDFEFSSARMSDADSVVSHADELFFQGQILPLKLPSRLHHHKSSSLSITLQLQDFSPRTSDAAAAPSSSSSFVHQLPSPKPLLKSPPRLSSPLQSPQRSKSPSKLAKVGFPDDNRFRSQSRHPASSPRRSLRELLHLNVGAKISSAILKPSDNRSASIKSSSGTDSRSGSLKSSGTDSRSSSNSSSSQRFSSSRSSSVSSNGGSVRSSSSSYRQVTPVSSRELLQNYNKSYKPQELRRKTLLPYGQSLLGCLGCLTVPSLRRVQDLEY